MTPSEPRPLASCHEGVLYTTSWQQAGGREGSGAFAVDGSPVEAFAVLPAGAAGELLTAAIAPGAMVLDLGCGAGRLAHVLAAHGCKVTGVDQCEAMLDWLLPGVEAVHADIEGLDLGRRFDAVILASFLVNTVDLAQRDAFLAACALHLAETGAVYVQRLDHELVPLAIDADSEEDGVVYSLANVTHDGDRFEATVGFAVDGQRWASPYAGTVLDDDAIAETLATHGLAVAGYLDTQRTWVVAR